MTYIVGNYKVTKYNSTNQLIFNILYHIYKNSKQLLKTNIIFGLENKEIGPQLKKWLKDNF